MRVKNSLVLIIGAAIALGLYSMPDVIPDWVPFFGTADNTMRLVGALGILALAVFFGVDFK